MNETEEENLTPTCNSMTPFATSRPAVLAHAVEPSSHKAINMQAVLVSLTQYNWTSVSVTLFSAWHQLAIQLKCDRSGNHQHRILIVSLILSFRNITASLSQSHYQNQDSFISWPNKLYSKWIRGQVSLQHERRNLRVNWIHLILEHNQIVHMLPLTSFINLIKWNQLNPTLSSHTMSMKTLFS